VRRVTLVELLICLLGWCAAAGGQWKPYTVLELHGREGTINRPAQFQIVTESWQQVAAGSRWRRCRTSFICLRRTGCSC
jgi:hypothetical protein